MDQISAYCLAHTTPAAPILLELERATHLRTIAPHMIAGPYQGAFLRMISCMIRPRRILEVGTFTGYATICLAAGLADDGLIHTIESDDELAPLFHAFIHEANLSSRVKLHTGDAADILPALGETFDLVFLDGGKTDYALHYELALAKTRSGGFLLADNVLWDGKVPSGNLKDPAALALSRFNDMIRDDDRVENILLPFRDGLMMIRKL